MSSRVPATVIGGLLLASTVHAEPGRNIELTVFDPTPTTSGSSFHVQNADVGASGDYVASAMASYANKPLVLASDNAGEMNVVEHHTKLLVGGAYAFAEKFEAGLRVPLYIQSGDAVPAGTTGVQPADGAALGDVTLHGKARLHAKGRLRAGASLGLTLPTGTNDEFTGTRLPTARVLGLISIAATRALTFHVNAGGILRERVQFANIEQGSGLAWGAALSLRAFEKVFINLEAFGDVIPSGDHGRPTATNPMGEASMLKTFEALAGARIQLTQQMSLSVGAGRGLSGGIGEPGARGVIAFAYTPGAQALPPLHVPGPAVVVDKTKEDTDYDKLMDAVDKCPEQGEDKDGFEDEDGCPEPDNDKDNVLDAKDKCPLAAEDLDSFEDGDGCAELDNDKDGVDDTADKCADKAEKINGKDDDDGCPDTGDSLVISNPDRLELLEPVLFKADDIDGESKNLLNQLAATLRARADITRIRIGVHVQPSKLPKKDQALSDRRATAVRGWLIKYGIKPERLEVKGFGGSNPLVKPDTKGASMINDRVELIILERH